LLIFSYLTFEDSNAHAEREWIRRLEWIPTIGLFVIAALGSRLNRGVNSS